MLGVLNKFQRARAALTLETYFVEWLEQDKARKEANEKLDRDIVRLSNQYLDWMRKLNCMS